MELMDTILEEGQFLTDPEHGVMNQAHAIYVSHDFILIYPLLIVLTGAKKLQPHDCYCRDPPLPVLHPAVVALQLRCPRGQDACFSREVHRGEM